mmetsp:Transcript_4470/g.12305  ORF Transcript_4470/g.12305 Transcript_4470/m.12305 type:complete len:143 (-) Transcript_4470:105-533(-)
MSEAHFYGADDEDRDDEQEQAKDDKHQLSERQAKALLAELTPKLREELCQVLRAQSQPDGERPQMSRELARILTRFQRRAGLGPGGRGCEDTGEETWPMYLGFVLFVVISVLFAFIYIQEQYGLAEEEREEEEDAYWLLREF